MEMKKQITIKTLRAAGARDDLAYWLSRSPAERIAAVEYLRRQAGAGSARLQRTARIIQRPSR